MAKVSPIQTAFNAGELSPLLYGRVDVDKYKNGLSTSINCIPLVQGGLTRRPGFKYGWPTKASGQARLIPFIYSITQAYHLEFGDLYLRIHKDQSVVTNTAQNITGITKANPGVVTYSGADTYANGDKVAITGVVGMGQVNNREFTVANVNAGANTFELSGVDTSAYDTYSSGGTVAEIYEVVTPYALADVPTLQYTQSADTLYITHPSYAPRKLTRTAHNSWTLTAITFLDGPYLATNTTGTTLTPSAATGTGVTITASAVTGINNDTGFAATDVGRVIRMKQGSTWGYARITGWTSTTVVTADVVNTLTSTAAKTDWRLGVWSGTTGYPAVAAFYQDRLFFAGATSYPQRIDGSNTGDYENFAPSATDGTVADSNACAFTLNSNDVNVIRWLAPTDKGLAVGTVGAEWFVKPADSSGALSPTNVSADPSTTFGSANARPVQSGKSTLFINRSKRKLRDLRYVFQNDSFEANDLTLLAEHITLGGIQALAYQQNPQSIVWSYRADGTLLGMTFEKDQSVTGWHRHKIGGAFGSGDPVVESVSCIPVSDGSRDELAVIVKRTINSATVRHIEYLTKLWEHGDAQEDAYQGADGGLTYDGTATTTIGSLFFLEGQTVRVLADGAAHPDCVVTNGKITLDRSSSVVQIGLGYNSDAAMLRIDAGSQDGTSQGKMQRIHRVIFRLHDTLGMKVGPDFDSLDEIIFRTASGDLGAAVPLFSGDVEKTWRGGYSTENLVCWRWYQCFPGTVLAVMPQMKTEDRG